MKKFFAILLCAMMLVSMMSVSVSASFLRTDTARVYKIDNIEDPENEPYTQGTEEDKYIQWYAYGNGWFCMIDGELAIMTTPVWRTDLEAVFWDESFSISPPVLVA